MAKKFLPTVETLRKLFNYCPETGLITHGMCAPWHNAIIGSGGKKKERVIGDPVVPGMPAELTWTTGKYLHILVNGQKVPAHRAAWAMHYGEWPHGDIDHINRDPSDNRIENLRIATKAENARNRTSVVGSTSKYLGVSKSGNAWVARIAQGGDQTDLGRFSSEDDAALAYDCAAIMMHREFANPNILKNPYLTGRLK